MTHPYAPKSLKLAHYTLPAFSQLEILTYFFSGIGVFLLVGWFLVKDKQHSWTNSQFGTKLVFMWFLLSGAIHLFVEGWYASHQKTIAGLDDFMSNVWKEYALSDSRYLSSDSFVWVMESITAFVWGPICFCICYLILNDSPKRHILQVVVSMGQLYGDVLYYLTTLVEGAPHTVDHPFYFWFYFVFLNAFWIVIPLVIIYSSGSIVLEALELVEDIFPQEFIEFEDEDEEYTEEDDEDEEVEEEEDFEEEVDFDDSDDEPVTVKKSPPRKQFTEAAPSPRRSTRRQN
ncbi:Emopamil binding protein-domain-containing protein [Gorgonomyces haynaldii]|nr:Emopamil binding protein-domain-containing protein [Gorgonomyces haynaldii]